MNDVVPPFGWIAPRSADRGASWAVAWAAELIDRRGDSKATRAVLRVEIADHARDLDLAGVDSAIERAASRVTRVQRERSERDEAAARFEQRARKALETVPAGRCVAVRAQLLDDGRRMGLETAHVTAVIGRISPLCPTSAAETAQWPLEFGRRVDDIQ